jgi:anti-sigma B factor antagonist
VTTPASSFGNAFTVTAEVISDVVVLVVAGELDTLTGLRLVDAGLDALSHKPRELIMDLDGVTFFSSAGLHAVIALRDVAGRMGSSFSVRNPSEPVRRIIQITKADF